MPNTSFTSRLCQAWDLLLGRAGRKTLIENEAALSAESESAGLRLDLEEAKRQADALRRQADAERTSRSEAVSQAVEKQLRGLFIEAAVLMGQLALQARLMEQGKPVKAEDVMALAQGLCRVLENHGMEKVGEPEESVTFDPNIHQPMSGQIFQAGEQVRVRVPGYRVAGKNLRKALVTKEAA